MNFPGILFSMVLYSLLCSYSVFYNFCNSSSQQLMHTQQLEKLARREFLSKETLHSSVYTCSQAWPPCCSREQPLRVTGSEQRCLIEQSEGYMCNRMFLSHIPKKQNRNIRTHINILSIQYLSDYIFNYSYYNIQRSTIY